MQTGMVALHNNMNWICWSHNDTNQKLHKCKILFSILLDLFNETWTKEEYQTENVSKKLLNSFSVKISDSTKWYQDLYLGKLGSDRLIIW